ncbi:hypothetical protein [Rothia sp. ZJ1223]|uniref:hypothetical protein n=1 Tax=Rothia sp. ZJ1223 TaxID=2811098 RepID=UPI00195D9D11|nr:hypothetical protein [Rothia sp. ZJ1223]MBM7051585.1 hypothetical protein [Rothia sp. ZJ1223]
MSAHPRHHKPIVFGPEKFANQLGGADPALISAAAYESAHAILGRARTHSDLTVITRLVEFTDHYGLETIAEMWSQAAAVSTPGALWRMYALRHTIRKNPSLISHYYTLGMESDQVSRVVSGVADPPTDREIVSTVDAILTGAYTGEFDVALERFAAFCKVVALGQDAVAHHLHFGETINSSPEAPQPANNPPTLEPSLEVRKEVDRKARNLRAGANRLTTVAAELEAAAAKWRLGTLD